MILLLDNNIVRGRRRVPPSASSLKVLEAGYKFWLTWLRRLIETFEVVRDDAHNAVCSHQHSCDILFTKKS